MLLLNLFNTNDLLVNLIGVLVYLSVLFIVMPAHEFAHAFVAKKQGDYTAYYNKRCTLAPFAHIDARGFLCLVLFGFGWAKPVPVDSRNFKNGKKSEFAVAVAGVVVNILQGFVFCGLYVAFLNFVPAGGMNAYVWYAYYTFFMYGAIISFSLALFNLLPVYPLDGFRMVEAIAKPGNRFVEFMKRNSVLMFFIVYLLIYMGFSEVLYPVVNGVLWLWQKFFGLFV